MNFARIYERAIERKGGEGALNALIPTSFTTLSREDLCRVPDDRFLSAMTQSVFQAGFNWDVVRKKWNGFEEAFWEFDTHRCAGMSPDDYDELLKDVRVVRNGQKIMTVPKNAQMILEVEEKHGSFARMVADWPASDFIGLLDYLKRNGSRLGGLTSQYFLRHIGRDGFILSKDGVAALIGAGVVDKVPTSKADMKSIQNSYNEWMNETGYSLTKISRILSLSIDA